MEFIDLKAQYVRLKTRIDQRIGSVLRHGKFIQGPEVQELEERLASYCGVKHAITVANGTDGLQLALMSLGIGPGDAVITTSFTFFATAEVIALVGAKPIFVDIDASTFNMDPVQLEAKIQEVVNCREERLKAVIAVDLFGLPADYNQIEAICRKHELPLIEDAAQSFGAQIGETKACNFGDIGVTSFFPAKPLGCYGDGGAIFTNSDKLAAVIRSLQVHGKGEDKYDNVRIGTNSRLDTIQAAILLEKLLILDEEILARQEIAKKYNAALSGNFVVPRFANGFSSAIAQYTLRWEGGDRSRLIERIKSKGIPVQVYYKKPIHKMRAFENLGIPDGAYPVSERASSEVISIPVHSYLSEEQQAYITKTLCQLGAESGNYVPVKTPLK